MNFLLISNILGDPLENKFVIGKISLTSPIVINVPTIAPLAVETKRLFFTWLANLNDKSNVCKQISSLELLPRTKVKSNWKEVMNEHDSTLGFAYMQV